MRPTTKPKRDTRQRDMRLASVITLLFAPVTVFAFVYAVAAFIAGWSFLGKGMDFAPDLIMTSGISIVFMTVFIAKFLYHISQKREQYQWEQQVNQRRVYAEDLDMKTQRLAYRPSPHINTHNINQSRQKTTYKQ